MDAKPNAEIDVDLSEDNPVSILDTSYNPLRAEIMALMKREATLNQASALIDKMDSNIPRIFKLDILTVITVFGKTNPGLKNTLKVQLQATQFWQNEEHKVEVQNWTLDTYKPNSIQITAIKLQWFL